MTFFNTLKTAYQALKTHKVRSGLTVLGLMIGVMSIILVLNLGQGIKDFVLGQLEMFGSDYIDIEIKVPTTSKTSAQNAIGLAQGISVTTLKIEDAEAISKHPNIRDYYTGNMTQSVVSFEDQNQNSMIWGVSASFFNLYPVPVVEGRDFTDEEDKSQARVVVIGSDLREKFFAYEDPIGKRIKIGNKNFTVIGVMEKQGNAFYMNLDETVYMPARTLQKQVLGIDYVQFILAYMHDNNKAAATSEDITQIMREQHNITDPNKDDFSVTSAEEATEILGVVTGGITLLLVAIATISLLVGGVGIMNIMYVSVKERTYEIGLRKAIGATNQNILAQFLWEAIFLTVLGGLVGLFIGTMLSTLGALGARYAGIDWQISFSWLGVILALGFSALVGLIFGIYPAKKASSLEPVEALRQE